MIVELELRALCEEFIDFLYNLKEQSLISEDELEFHLKQKINFIKQYEETLKL